MENKIDLLSEEGKQINTIEDLFFLIEKICKEGKLESSSYFPLKMPEKKEGQSIKELYKERRKIRSKIRKLLEDSLKTIKLPDGLRMVEEDYWPTGNESTPPITSDQLNDSISDVISFVDDKDPFFDEAITDATDGILAVVLYFLNFANEAKNPERILNIWHRLLKSYQGYSLKDIHWKKKKANQLDRKDIISGRLKKLAEISQAPEIKKENNELYKSILDKIKNKEEAFGNKKPSYNLKILTNSFLNSLAESFRKFPKLEGYYKEKWINVLLKSIDKNIAEIAEALDANPQNKIPNMDLRKHVFDTGLKNAQTPDDIARAVNWLCQQAIPEILEEELEYTLVLNRD